MKLRLLLLAAVIALAGSVAFYFQQRPAPEIRSESGAEVAVPPLTVEVPTQDFLNRLVKKSEREITAPGEAPPVKLDQEMLPWERALVEILHDPGTAGTKAEQIFALLPSLPEEALGPATSQALEWLRDADYNEVALPLLLNVHTHGAIEAELYRDLMERPEALSLPALLTMARTPEHSYTTAAHENLELLLGQDFANDWSAWGEAIQERLAAEK